MKTAELINGKYYLILTIENKWGVALWEDKWWSDEYQDGKVLMGIREDFIKEYYSLPLEQNTPNRNKVMDCFISFIRANHLSRKWEMHLKEWEGEYGSLSLPTLSEELDLETMQRLRRESLDLIYHWSSEGMNEFGYMEKVVRHIHKELTKKE
jgi:hypothetical protein